MGDTSSPVAHLPVEGELSGKWPARMGHFQREYNAIQYPRPLIAAYLGGEVHLCESQELDDEDGDDLAPRLRRAPTDEPLNAAHMRSHAHRHGVANQRDGVDHGASSKFEAFYGGNIAALILHRRLLHADSTGEQASPEQIHLGVVATVKKHCAVPAPLTSQQQQRAVAAADAALRAYGTRRKDEADAPATPRRPLS